MEMAEKEFTLVIDGPVKDDQIINALFEHGCDDATFGAVDGVGYADFHREAPNLADAVFSAIKDVESVAGLTVLRVEPDDLVTLSEIAQRLGRTRESVRLLAAGERGGGEFPAPVSHLRSRNRLWRWSDVAAWAGVDGGQEVEQAQLLAAMNAALELRNRSATLPRRERERVEALAR
jgi:hypothetical protein